MVIFHRFFYVYRYPPAESGNIRPGQSRGPRPRQGRPREHRAARPGALRLAGQQCAAAGRGLSWITITHRIHVWYIC